MKGGVFMWQFLKRLYHKLGSPKWCYELTGRWLPYFSVVTLILLVWGTVWALAFVPEDYQQGNTVRIMYIHVPTAILAQSTYMMMAVAGAVFLIWNMKVADMVAKSIAMIGASMSALALITGAIWGKPTWGTYWVWDARLTSMLLQLFLFFGYMALRESFEDPIKAGKASAILALVGLVNIPIIKYSVVWWNTLHQPATITLTEKPAMPAEMWMPLLVMVIGFYCLFAVLLMMRTRNEILQREHRSKWVRDLVK